ncbi:Carboxypeptidase regulatory-like domain-containing protein [Bryocella elongata]|uniref:Carboxypeptidase regulatory-like domain-containing protein n=1 Tax=Bryocella elongata TaxID=863522 RepID=A0A1H5ZLZ5_9BACT|nr:carboxypeptidase-like regulatory domain-containing protein [Bryocella elongata]SEG37160.1 Carboxypeptidase regulatory-like domain-containing protein [Bryocella elongata]
MNVFTWHTIRRARTAVVGRGFALAGALTVGLMLWGGAHLHAQGITGTITGTVSDPSGAAVPGATVTITQPTTNTVHTITTSDNGSFTLTQLPPGDYIVKVDHAGFQSYRQTGVHLTIDQTLSLAPTLTVGEVSQVVEVSGGAPVIQTDDSSVGSVIEAQAIQNTPLNGHLSVMGLMVLAPGIQGVGAQDQLATRGLTVAAGTGSRNAYGGLASTLDGVSNAEVTLQRAEPEVPPLDAISQFKFISTGAPAEFGQPAALIVASASGTNQFHGELLEYNRSKGMGAKGYFSGSSARPPYQRNEFGGNFTGPIWIPKVYNGKDRSFFFFAYEGFRLTQSYSDNTQQPTTLMRQGVFTEFPTLNLVDPTTGLSFANQTIPTARINAVSAQLLTLLMPKVTTSGTGVNTYEQVAETSVANRISVRLDHKLSSKDQIRFTYLRAFYGPSPTNGSDSLQGGNAQDGEHNSNFILGWTHTFSPSLLLDTYGSFFHLPIYRTPQNYKTDFSSIIPGLGQELIEGAPQISITNIQSISESGSKDLEQVGQLGTNLTKVTEKHTLKMGFSVIYDNHWNDSAVSPQRGSFSFTGQYSGNAFADFLLGYPVKTIQAVPNNFITRNISAQYAGYIQDDWKPLRNLTINAGIRYDLQWFRDNPYGLNSLYVPSLKEVVVFGSSYPAASISNFLTSIPIALSGTAGLPSSVFAYLGQDKKNVAPRIGFAYEAVPHTVLRGAFGIYYNLLPASYVGTAPFGTLPFSGSATYNNASGSTPTFSMSNPFSATGSFAANPSVLAQAPTTTPYTEEYNLAVEHEFSHNWDVRIGYVGQHNLKQNNYGGSGNYAPNINLPAQPVLIKNGSVTAQSLNLVQPFSTIGLNLDPIFHSTSNSLQLGAHHQYHNGLAFGAEYQWIRSLGTENIENPSGATPNDSYGPIGGIAPQVLTVNYSYQLPFGKGKAFLGSSNDFVDKLVSGWQVSGISVFQNGQPFSVTYTAPGSYTDGSGNKWTNLVSGRANRVAGVALYPTTKTKAQWFNAAAFTAPVNSSAIPGGAYGNSGYDMLRGPRYQDWDINLEKNITFNERYHVQLRADSFNVFNHPNLSTPNANISNTSTVGTITSASGTPTYEQRTVEFAAKFSF